MDREAECGCRKKEKPSAALCGDSDFRLRLGEHKDQRRDHPLEAACWCYLGLIKVAQTTKSASGPYVWLAIFAGRQAPQGAMKIWFRDIEREIADETNIKSHAS